jgi:hypothetical protein
MIVNNSLPNVIRDIKVVDPEEIYNILLLMQQKIQLLEGSVRDLQNASKS